MAYEKGACSTLVLIAIISMTALSSKCSALPAKELRGQCVSDLFVVAGVDQVSALNYEKMMARQSIPVVSIKEADTVFLRIAGIMSTPDRMNIVNCFSHGDAESNKSRLCRDFKPCSGVGVCQLMNEDGIDQYSCKCTTAGRHGSRCERNVCDPNQCQNGGQCVPLVDSVKFNCICPAGYTGDLCEKRVNHCENHRCLNGGVCESLATGPICHCAIGSSGDNCERRWLTYDLLTGIRDTVNKVFELLENQRLRSVTSTPSVRPVTSTPSVRPVTSTTSVRPVTYRLYNTEIKTWREAVSACERVGGQLAMIRNAEEQAKVIRSREGESRSVWLGATDEGHEGTWLYVNQEPVTFTNWGRTEPNNAFNNEHCLVHHEYEGQWNDVPCSSRLPYLCEFR